MIPAKGHSTKSQTYITDMKLVVTGFASGRPRRSVHKETLTDDRQTRHGHLHPGGCCHGSGGRCPMHPPQQLQSSLIQHVTSKTHEARHVRALCVYAIT